MLLNLYKPIIIFIIPKVHTKVYIFINYLRNDDLRCK